MDIYRRANKECGAQVLETPSHQFIFTPLSFYQFSTPTLRLLCSARLVDVTSVERHDDYTAAVRVASSYPGTLLISCDDPSACSEVVSRLQNLSFAVADAKERVQNDAQRKARGRRSTRDSGDESFPLTEVVRSPTPNHSRRRLSLGSQSQPVVPKEVSPRY